MIDDETVVAPGYQKQLAELKEVGQHSIFVYGANLTANGTRTHRQWLADHLNTLKIQLDELIATYVIQCPPAGKLAEVISATNNMLPYVHIITTHQVSDLINYADQRTGGYFNLKHKYDPPFLEPKNGGDRKISSRCEEPGDKSQGAKKGPGKRRDLDESPRKGANMASPNKKKDFQSVQRIAVH
uniref:Doublecortin domain-containing protein n=1 Tax=Steinernema glaseri TaxID=37863 RepID=A0A1I7Z5C9_9BILA